MGGTRGHLLHTGVSILVHQNKKSRSTGGDAQLTAVKLLVPMPPSHEKLISDGPWHQGGISPEDRTFRFFGDREPGLGHVQKLVREHLGCLSVIPITVQISDRSTNLNNPIVV